MHRFGIAVALVILYATEPPVLAQEGRFVPTEAVDVKRSSAEQPHQDPTKESPKPQPAPDEVNTKFAGLSFGIGLSFTWDVVDRERIDEATVDVNGVVRVTKKSNALARIMLESHYFFTPSRWKSAGIAKAGWGPFVALQPGSNEIINALGAGIMFGFRRADSGQSFNIGLGYSVDPSTKILGDEFAENQPAPVDKDLKPLAIRYQTRDQGGFLLLSSFTWR